MVRRGARLEGEQENYSEIREVLNLFQVMTLDPSSRDLSALPAADWLIGNHSDELTPWIPVMAAR